MSLFQRPPKPLFTVNYGERPPTCFPSNTDMGELRNISTLTDQWAKFINTRTGEIVDCAEYARLAQAAESLK